MPSCDTSVIKLLLYGDDLLELVTNTLILHASVNFILSSKRYDGPLLLDHITLFINIPVFDVDFGRCKIYFGACLSIFSIFVIYIFMIFSHTSNAHNLDGIRNFSFNFIFIFTSCDPTSLFNPMVTVVDNWIIHGVKFLLAKILVFCLRFCYCNQYGQAFFIELYIFSC